MRLVAKIIIGIVAAFALLVAAFFLFGRRLLINNAMSAYMERQITEQYGSAFETEKRKLEFPTSDSPLTQEIVSDLDTFLETATIPDIQARFVSAELDAETLVLYCLQRTQAFDENKLNSVLELNPDALEIARALDTEREDGKVRGSLHGIPVLLKDNIATGDKLHTSAGALALKDARGDTDAFIVERLRDAGAIILGKANLSELSNYMTSESVNGYSTLGGHTRNPYGRFDVGGSSSGPSVAASANFATVTVGTETAGSLIYPAGQNSVVAFKPSLGAVSRDRIIPITEAQDTAGPIGRNVTDVAVLLSVLTAEDKSDPRAADAATLSELDFTSFLEPNALQGKRIGVIKSIGLESNLKQDVIGAFEEAGAEVVEVTWQPARVNYVPVLEYGIKHDLQAYFDTVGEASPVRSLIEVIAFNKANLEVAAPYGQDLLEAAQEAELSETDYEAMVSANEQKAVDSIRSQLTENNLDAFLSVSNELSGDYAPAGFPAITVPAGYKASGEPVGITLLGDYLSDAELIGIAYAFEQKMGARVAPNLSRWELE